MAENQNPESALRWKRTDDFRELYCNNVRFESSVWDVKALLGTLDQGNPDPTVHLPGVYFHTGVTMPWVQAKIALYNLYIAILFHEQANGIVSVPDAVKPPTVAEVVPEFIKQPEGGEFAAKADAFRALIFGA